MEKVVVIWGYWRVPTQVLLEPCSEPWRVKVRAPHTHSLYAPGRHRRGGSLMSLIVLGLEPSSLHSCLMDYCKLII